MGRFWDFIKDKASFLLSDKKKVIGSLVLGILVLALPIGIYLLRQQQVIKSRAAVGDYVKFVAGVNAELRNGQWVTMDGNAGVDVELDSPMGPADTSEPTPAPSAIATAAPTLPPPPSPPPVSFGSNLLNPAQFNPGEDNLIALGGEERVNDSGSYRDTIKWITGSEAQGNFALFSNGTIRVDAWGPVKSDGGRDYVAQYQNYAVFSLPAGADALAVVWNKNSGSVFKLTKPAGTPQIVNWFTGNTQGTYKIEGNSSGGVVQVDEYSLDSQGNAAGNSTSHANGSTFTVGVNKAFVVILRRVAGDYARFTNVTLKKQQ